MTCFLNDMYNEEYGRDLEPIAREYNYQMLLFIRKHLQRSEGIYYEIRNFRTCFALQLNNMMN